VRQVGYLQILYRDARSTEHKKDIYLLGANNISKRQKRNKNLVSGERLAYIIFFRLEKSDVHTIAQCLYTYLQSTAIFRTQVQIVKVSVYNN